MNRLFTFITALASVSVAHCQELLPSFVLSPRAQEYCGNVEQFDAFGEAWEAGEIYLAISIPEDSTATQDSLQLQGQLIISGNVGSQEILTLHAGEEVIYRDISAPWYSVGQHYFTVSWNDTTWNANGEICSWNVPCISVDERNHGSTSFELSANPNPFNPSCMVSFKLPTSTETFVDLIDLRGRIVQSLKLGRLSSGANNVELQADNLSSGTYIVRARAGQFVGYTKVILIK